MIKQFAFQKLVLITFFLILRPLHSNKNFLLFFKTNHRMKSAQTRSYFWSVFSCIRTEYGDSVFSPNTGKYGPEITPHLDTFHAVNDLPIMS